MAAGKWNIIIVKFLRFENQHQSFGIKKYLCKRNVTEIWFNNEYHVKNVKFSQFNTVLYEQIDWKNTSDIKLINQAKSIIDFIAQQRC